MKKLAFAILVSFLWSCSKDKPAVDLIVTNANVYTVNQNFEKAEAFAITDGKFLEIGNAKELQEKYAADSIWDAKGQTIVPGFIDAHCHFYSLGLEQNKVNLMGTKSFEEVMKRVLNYQNKKQTNFIVGRGWDQNDWEVKEFPNKALLDKLYPTIPVALTRVDGHALLCNQAALDLAGITESSAIDGGEFIKENGKLTGVLIDNAIGLVWPYYPVPSKSESIEALYKAQDICFNYGLTTVSDAGLDKEIINLIDSLQQSGELDMRVYAMISNTAENLDYFLPKGKIKTEKLNVQSVKVYADGALGSRGAVLKQPYSDQENHFGAMVIGVDAYQELANRIVKSEYQMNTHAIGDSANRVVLQVYNKVLEGQNDRRWRVEHAQVLTDNDLDLFANENIIPSVQPTHATSDMYWADERLGEERIKGAYAYKQLLDTSGKVALGTDFPVEKVSPFLTFYAAVSRKDLNRVPSGGFQSENKLTREETLKGMTIWAAYSNFEDQEKGSIEVGKYADFIVLNKDIMTVNETQIPNIQVLHTFVAGEKK